jgi:mono/diheme cytochrome c family protein
VIAGLEPLEFLGFQASNGQDSFNAQCASCHGLDLLGRNGMAPPLIGEAFEARWFGGPVFELYDFIRRQKPPGNPSSLTNSTYLNMVTYILRENGFASNLDNFLAPTMDVLMRTGFYQY